MAQPKKVGKSDDIQHEISQEKVLDSSQKLLYKLRNVGGLRRFFISKSEEQRKIFFNNLPREVASLITSLKAEDISPEEGMTILISLEFRYKEIVRKPDIRSGFIFSCLGVVALAPLLFDCVRSFLFETPHIHFVIAISGTILSYAIKVLSSDKFEDRFKILLARLTTTLVVSFVLYASLDNSGKFSDKATVNLIFFACGYSVQVVMTLLKKTVEKVNGMIETL